MKGTISNFLVGLLVVFSLACSREPVQEINAAKSAVDAAMSEGAEKYSPAEARKVDDELAAAVAEVNGQDGRLLKDYKKSKEMLAEVKSDAEAMKAGLAAKKQEAKKRALDALEAAASTVKEAEALLSKTAQSGKTNEDLDALNVDAKGLDGDLLELKNLIDTEDYTTAIEKAGAVKRGAAALSEKAARMTSAATAPKKKGTKQKKSS
jgi:hypothetical protein